MFLDCSFSGLLWHRWCIRGQFWGLPIDSLPGESPVILALNMTGIWPRGVGINRTAQSLSITVMSAAVVRRSFSLGESPTHCLASGRWANMIQTEESVICLL